MKDLAIILTVLGLAAWPLSYFVDSFSHHRRIARECRKRNRYRKDVLPEPQKRAVVSNWGGCNPEAR